jgi:hypothetical protein
MFWEPESAQSPVQKPVSLIANLRQEIVPSDEVNGCPKIIGPKDLFVNSFLRRQRNLSLSCANMKTRGVIALVAMVKKPRRVFRGVRFGLTVFGFIIATPRNFIALCGWVSTASGSERRYMRACSTKFFS